MLRSPTLSALGVLVSSFTIVLFSAALTSQTAREAMWPAPTAADWAKPVPIRWQRSWEDAVAVAGETGKAILVCVNMDGEIASEHYAGIRYRDPEIAKLYEPYVCVIASVYRHNPRDFDEEGRRIPCPRFGCVTCGEHIAIEPFLFENFMEGQRIAPRHIMVELDADGRVESESYDIYYAFDTDSVFGAIRNGIATRSRQPNPPRRGDRSLLERMASRDSSDRESVEAAYGDADRDRKLELLEAALAAGADAPPDMLRQAVFDLDGELAALARQALAKARSADATEVINEALRVPLDDSERADLVAALERIGEDSARARTLAIVHRGLDARSSGVDVAEWSDSLAGAEYPAPTVSDLTDRVEDADRAAKQSPTDAGGWLDAAESTLELAVDPQMRRILAAGRQVGRRADRYRALMFEDARRALERAVSLGAESWRVDAIAALLAYYRDDLETAYSRVVPAAENLPPGTRGWTGMATLALFAVARQKAITAKIRAREDWPREWLTDIHAAYEVLSDHPLGEEQHVVDHYDFLRWLGGHAKAASVLENGLERYPESWALHERLRARLLRDDGIAALDATYDRMLETPGASPNLPWFAGYAAIVSAEFYRRRGNPDAARAEYQRAIDLFERNATDNPDSASTSEHYVAMALGGRARVRLEAGELEPALADVLASFERRPDAAATLDGLNLSAVDTAKMLRQRLQDAGESGLVAEIQRGLDALDPKMLELPAYEGASQGGSSTGRRPGRGGRARRSVR